MSSTVHVPLLDIPLHLSSAARPTFEVVARVDPIDLTPCDLGAGVPTLMWSLAFDQFIEERMVTNVLRIRERVSRGARTTRHEECEVVLVKVMTCVVVAFLEPGGVGEAARFMARDLVEKARAAVVESGSSARDLRRLVADLIQAKPNCN